MSPDTTMAIARRKLTRTTFGLYRDLIYRVSGISLGEGKEGLVRTRIGKRMRALHLTDYEEYFERIVSDPTGQEMVRLIDAITTNVTSFFREDSHFVALVAAVKGWLGEGRRQLRLWSAACSTGEEPYTMAMSVREALAGELADLRILATDLSTRALDQARQGVYRDDRMAAVPRSLRERWFEADGPRPTAWRARRELRHGVSFARLNLSEVPFPMSGPFDAVFCRNVMIYFDAEVRRRLVSEIRRLLRPGGLLFVGHSESLTGLTTGLKAVEPSVWVKA